MGSIKLWLHGDETPLMLESFAELEGITLESWPEE